MDGGITSFYRHEPGEGLAARDGIEWRDGFDDDRLLEVHSLTKRDRALISNTTARVVHSSCNSLAPLRRDNTDRLRSYVILGKP
jgi:hypothetical protein